MQQSVLDRYRIFAKRKFYSFIKSLTPSRIIGRFNGPKVLANSIPKSGTNLLDQVLYNMPGLSYSGRRTLRERTHSVNKIISILKGTGKGFYHLGHICYNPLICDELRQNNIKSILIIRDPRQVLVSHYKYVTYIDTNHVTHNYFKNLKDDFSRLNALIDGVPNIVEPIKDVLKSYEGWFDDTNTLVIKFEDLVGKNGGGSDEKQRMVINKIAQHIGVNLTEEQKKEIAKRVYSVKSPTFRAGQLNSWKKDITTEQQKLIKEKIGDWIVKFGYETNQNW